MVYYNDACSATYGEACAVDYAMLECYAALTDQTPWSQSSSSLRYPLIPDSSSGVSIGNGHHQVCCSAPALPGSMDYCNSLPMIGLQYGAVEYGGYAAAAVAVSADRQLTNSADRSSFDKIAGTFRSAYYMSAP